MGSQTFYHRIARAGRPLVTILEDPKKVFSKIQIIRCIYHCIHTNWNCICIQISITGLILLPTIPGPNYIIGSEISGINRKKILVRIKMQYSCFAFILLSPVIMLGFISYYHIDFEKLEIVEQPEIGEPTIYFFIGLLSLDSFEFLYKRT